MVMRMSSVPASGPASAAAWRKTATVRWKPRRMAAMKRSFLVPKSWNR